MVKIENLSPNKHSHIFDIGVFPEYLTCKHSFFDHSEEFGQVNEDSERPISDNLVASLPIKV